MKIPAVFVYLLKTYSPATRSRSPRTNLMLHFSQLPNHAFFFFFWLLIFKLDIKLKASMMLHSLP